MSSIPPTPPSGPPGPDDQPPGGDPTQAYPPQGYGQPPAPEPKRNRWLLPVLVVLLVLGVAAGVIASENKSKPSTVVNQQSTSTVNSIGVNVQPSQPAQTVTAPTQTVTAPTKTVTAPPKTVTTPVQPATPPKTTTTTGATP